MKIKIAMLSMFILLSPLATAAGGHKKEVSYKKINGIYAAEIKLYEQVGNTYQYKSTYWECFIGYPQDPVEFGGKNGGRDWLATDKTLGGCAAYIKFHSGG